MTIIRSATVAACALLALVSCGKKEQPAPEPAPAAAVKEANNADELFDEFFDSSAHDEAAMNEGSSAAAEAKAAEAAMKGKKGSAAQPKATTTEPAPKAKNKAKSNPDGPYVLQVSCVASEELAESVAKKLEKTGVPVYIAEVQNPTPQLMGTYYRIRVGGFSDKETAKAFGDAELTPKGFTFWVDTRANDNIGTAVNAKAEAAQAKTPPAQTAEEW